MKNRLLTLAIVFLSSLFLLLQTNVSVAGQKSTQMKPVHFPTVGSLTKELDDVGCAFISRSSKESAGSILIDGAQGAWMNINGVDRELTRVENTSEISDSRQRYFLSDSKDGKIDLILNYGHCKQNEAGSTCNRASLTISNQGRKKIILLKGGCGC